MRSFLVYLMLVAAGVIGAAGDIFLNQWAKSGGIRPLVFSFALWIVAVACFACVLKFHLYPFGAAVVLGLLVHAALAVVFDRLCFGGRLSVWQWAGIACAAAAIILINGGGSVCRSSESTVQNAGVCGR